MLASRSEALDYDIPAVTYWSQHLTRWMPEYKRCFPERAQPTRTDETDKEEPTEADLKESLEKYGIEQFGENVGSSASGAETKTEQPSEGAATTVVEK